MIARQQNPLRDDASRLALYLGFVLNMIRPSPTSITLSAKDISYHLQHIDVYHGLLKQGFKKRDIYKYFREQQKPQIKDAHRPVIRGSPESPKHVEPKVHRQFQMQSATLRCTAEDTTPPLLSDQSTEKEVNIQDTGEALDSKTYRPQQAWILPKQAGKLSSETYGQRIQQPTDEVSSCKPHAPRQSSLLRFSSKISSDEHTDPYPSPRIMTSTRSKVRYRHRTQTYSYDTSERGSDDSTCSSLMTVFNELVLDESLVPMTICAPQPSHLRGEALDFKPAGETISTTGTNNLYSPSIKPVSISTCNSASPPSISGTSYIVPILRSRHSEYSMSRSRRVSSSPPLIPTPRLDQQQQRPESPTLPHLPRTPASVSHMVNTRTEPRHDRFSYLDGPSFTPYNDSIPAALQPQTPAELTRQPVINEMNAAYTALPGRLRGDTGTLRTGSALDEEQGQESPTNRAISMRRRRTREYARSARVEGLRVSRLRTRPQPQGDGEEGRGDQQDGIWNIDEQFNLWRDDLDADRVGEENFEDIDAATETTGTGMRVVSGNRHANGV